MIILQLEVQDEQLFEKQERRSRRVSLPVLWWIARTLDPWGSGPELAAMSVEFDLPLTLCFHDLL
jgi:hypothetical protein